MACTGTDTFTLEQLVHLLSGRTDKPVLLQARTQCYKDQTATVQIPSAEVHDEWRVEWQLQSSNYIAGD